MGMVTAIALFWSNKPNPAIWIFYATHFSRYTALPPFSYDSRACFEAREMRAPKKHRAPPLAPPRPHRARVQKLVATPPVVALGLIIAGLPFLCQPVLQRRGARARRP
jgi:hypothetical protein